MTARIPIWFIFIAAVGTGCASQGTSPALDGTQAPSTEPASAQTAPAPTRAAGIRVYKDPQTGEFVDPPLPATAPVERTLNRSHEGLVETPNTAVPNGGVKLDLQGRFRSHSIATKDADGNISVRCQPENDPPKP